MPNSNGILTAPISIGDVQTVLNVSSSDLGDLCRSNKINMYSAHKPMRWGNPCGLVDASTGQDIRYSLKYGIISNNSNVDLKLKQTTQNPYWDYAKPRGKGGGDNGGNEWYRLLDFDEYDHNALCPVKTFTVPDTMRLSGTSFWLDLEEVFVPTNTPHLEITLDALPGAFAAESEYFGVCVWNKTRKIGYYLTTKYTLRQVVNQSFDSYSQLSIGLDGISGFEGGDECELFYCCSSTCTEDMPGEQEGSIVWVRATQNSEVQLIAPDASHGHAEFTIVAFNILDNIGFQSGMVNNGYVNFYGSIQNSDFVMTGFGCRLQCDYNWPSSGLESFDLTFTLVVEGSSTWTKTDTLVLQNASQYYQLSMNGSYTKGWSELRDDEGEVSAVLYVRMAGQPTSSNVRIGQFIYNTNTSNYSFYA